MRTWSDDRHLVFGLLWIVFARTSPPETADWMVAIFTAIGIGHIAEKPLGIVFEKARKRFLGGG